MSYFVGGAIVVSAVAGAVSSDRAADKQSKGVQKGLDQSAQLANQARADVMGLFDRSARISGMTFETMMDYYKTAAPKRMSPYLQGNKQAQTVIGQGAQQANNAILGLPVDMSFTNQPQIVPGTDHLNVDLPDYNKAVNEEITKENEAIAEAQKSTKKDPGYLTGGGIFRSPLDKNMLDPKERLENPLGLSDSLSKKLNPKNVLKKLF